MACKKSEVLAYKWIYGPAICLAVMFMDYISKVVIVRRLALGENITLIQGIFSLSHYENTGAGWGILPDSRYLLIFTSVAVSAFLIYYYATKVKSGCLKIFIPVILGGTLGNLTDRIIRGKVVDFLNFSIMKYNFPVFNFADSAIVIGTLVVMYCTLTCSKEKGGII